MGVRNLLTTGLGKVIYFGLGLKIVLGVIESGLSKVLIFAAQISLRGVSKLSKNRIQVVGGW